jgi:predicted RNA binding protein with dsRBD fold (UPF0201 family)
MGIRIRNSEFVDYCKELTRLGNSQTQILQKLKEKFKLQSVSRSTVRRALQEGIQGKYRIR